MSDSGQKAYPLETPLEISHWQPPLTMSESDYRDSFRDPLEILQPRSISAKVCQRQHLREWATKHMVECDALAAGLLKSPFSTVFFGDRKALRFGGSLPDGGQSPLPYTFYFYPLNKPAVEIANIGGNLFLPPHHLQVSFHKPGVLSGTVILRIETDKMNRRFITTDVDCKTLDGTVYKGKYYLFTLPPRRTLNMSLNMNASELSPETFEGYSAETFEERIPVPIYFLPVVRVMQWFRSLTKHGNGGKQDWPAQNKKKLIEDF